MLSYFVALPVILIFINSFIRKRIIVKIIDWLTYTFILLYTLTAIGEMCLYREWKAKLSIQALEHFLHPSEVFRTTSLGLSVVFFFFIIIIVLILIKGL